MLARYKCKIYCASNCTENKTKRQNLSHKGVLCIQRANSVSRRARNSHRYWKEAQTRFLGQQLARQA